MILPIGSLVFYGTVKNCNWLTISDRFSIGLYLTEDVYLATAWFPEGYKWVK